jgi:hypothetical protein
MMEKISKTPNPEGKMEAQHRSEQKTGSPYGEGRKNPDLSR